MDPKLQIRKKGANVQARVEHIRNYSNIVEAPKLSVADQWQSLSVLNLPAKDIATSLQDSSAASSSSNLDRARCCPCCDAVMEQGRHKCMALHPCMHIMCKACSRSQTNDEGAIICGLCNALVEAVVVATSADIAAAQDVPIAPPSHRASLVPATDDGSRSSSPDRRVSLVGSISAESSKLQAMATRKYHKQKSACRSLEKRTTELLTRLAQMDLSLTSKADTGAEIKHQIDDVDRDMERLRAKRRRLVERFESHKEEQDALTAIIDNTREELSILRKDYNKSLKQLEGAKAQLQLYNGPEVSIAERRGSRDSWGSMSSVSTVHSTNSASLLSHEARPSGSPLLSRESTQATMSPPILDQGHKSRHALIAAAETKAPAPPPPAAIVTAGLQPPAKPKRGAHVAAGATPPRPSGPAAVSSKSIRSQHRRSRFLASEQAASAVEKQDQQQVKQPSNVQDTLQAPTPGRNPSVARLASLSSSAVTSSASLTSAGAQRRGVPVILDDDTSDDEGSDGDDGDDDYEELSDICATDHVLNQSDLEVANVLSKAPSTMAVMERRDSVVLQSAIAHSMGKTVASARSHEAVSVDKSLNATAIDQMYSDDSDDEDDNGGDGDDISLTAVQLALEAAAHMENVGDEPDYAMQGTEDILMKFGRGTIC